MRPRALHAAILLLALALGLAQAQAPLRVVGSNGVRAVVEELATELEAAAGIAVVYELSTARTLTARLVAGEPFDVGLLTPSLIDELATAGVVDVTTRHDFARVGVGAGARAGAGVAPIVTREDLRDRLMAATSVAYGANGQSRETNEAAFAALGVTQSVLAKQRLTGAGEAPELLAAGEVDLVLTLVSELVNVPGVEFLGPYPPDLQGYITFTAAIAADTQNRAAASRYVDAVRGAGFQAALARHGLERAEP